ncbi:DEAD/DEAH box helicase, partial [Acinetobacter nosocomialis]
INLSREEIEEFDEKGLYSLVSYLRSLYKVDENHFKKMINSSELSRESKEDISSQLEELSLNLEIPDEIIAKNPFIDPVLQNIFYQDILKNGVES